MTPLMIGISILMTCCLGFAWLSARNSLSARIATAAVMLSFGYWYLLPALNIFFIGFDVDQIEASRDNVAFAFVIVGVFLSLTLFVIMLVPLLWPTSREDRRRDGPVEILNDRRLSRLGTLLTVSSAAMFISRFGGDGSELLLRMALGEVSARTNMEFYNISSGVLSSLDGLWEIANISICCLLICICTAARNSYGSTRLLAIISLVVMFIATGTRSLVIYVMVAALLTILARPKAPRQIRTRADGSSWLKRLPVILLFLVATSAAIGAYASRFQDYELDVGGAVLQTLVGNNDMLRELAAVLGRIDRYNAVGVSDFIQTPFTFLMPRFLGFDKQIPEHLLIYNRDLMAIDLRYDQGNYFPGLVADFVMVFGPWLGAVALAAFMCAILLVVRGLARRVPGLVMSTAFIASSMALVFVSVRNIPGSMALSVLILLSVSCMLARTRAGVSVPLQARIIPDARNL